MEQSSPPRIPVETTRIFVFDDVYPARAAQEQAEKKKLGAFGMLAKFNPLNRPRDETVQLARHEMRLEPFWHVTAQRSVDYSCQLVYQVLVNNPHAKTLQIDGRVFEVARQKDKGRIEFVGTEICHRKIRYDRLIDGMQRDIKSAALESLVNKYKFDEVAALDRPDQTLLPLVPLVAAQQMARAALVAEAINAYDIQSDEIVFERAYMYLRPVFAFEYRWTTADRSGVIEVDGLTGEVVEDGRWFKDKVERVITRDMLLELGAEVADGLVPGGGLAVKVIGRLTE